MTGAIPRAKETSCGLRIDGVPFYERLAEALRNARSSVWAIVSFVQPAFVLPDGTHWWKALRDCRDRGVDVRVLFW